MLLGLLFPPIVGLAVAFFSLYSSSSSFRTRSLVRSRFLSSLILRILMKIFASSRPYLLWSYFKIRLEGHFLSVLGVPTIILINSIFSRLSRQRFGPILFLFSFFSPVLCFLVCFSYKRDHSMYGGIWFLFLVFWSSVSTLSAIALFFSVFCGEMIYCMQFLSLLDM